jgi:SAM-dependent methyltransferase
VVVLAWVIIGLLLPFGFTGFVGAPYIPTHRRQVELALDLLHLQVGDVVVDLGSGDGVFLQAAARRGLRAYGYEINPLLCLVAWLRCRRFGKLVTVRWRDFWLSELPLDTKAVFVFAAGPFMNRLERKLRQTVAKRHEPLYVASYGFALPGHEPIAAKEGILLFRLEG